MNLILFKRSELSKDGKSIPLADKDPRTKHIFGHLRKVDGDCVTIGIIAGGQGKAIVRTSGGDEKWLEIVEGDVSVSIPNQDKDGESSEIVLLLSLPFPKRLKALWPQITSMGVTRICLIRGALSDPNYCKTSAIAPEVYRPLVEEGMSQGCHTKEVAVEVEVHEVVSQDILEKLGLYKSAEEWSSNGEAAVFLDCGDETIEPPPCRKVIIDQLSQIPDATNRRCVIIAIGSERGWTESEAKLFHDAGFRSASLGRSILRVDTAVIAGLGIVSATLDELQSEQQHIDEEKTMDTSRKRKQNA